MIKLKKLQNILTYLFLIAVFFSSTQVCAKEPYFEFDEVGYQYGMTNGVVLQVFQDQQGYLWSATQDGLHRFDGYQFKIFKNIDSDQSSLANNYVQTIFEDRDSQLWVGTSGGVLHKYNPLKENFTRFRFDETREQSVSSGSRIMSIDQDKVGSLWVATYGAGVYRFDIEKEQFISVYRSGSKQPNTIRSDNVLSLLIDHLDNLWIASENHLYQFIGEDNHLIEQSVPNNTDAVIYKIFEDSNNDIWLATLGDGLIKIDTGLKTTSHYKHDKHDSNSLSGNHVTSIFEDKNNHLWIGTRYGGLNRLNKNKKQFERFVHDPLNSNTISNNTILSILQDQSGLFWLGTMGNFLNRVNTSVEQFGLVKHDPQASNSLSSGNVRAIIKDRKGDHWIGTDNGLEHYNSRTKTFTNYQFDSSKPYSLSANDVRAIYEDLAGNLWVGTASGGLNRLSYVNRTANNIKFERYKNEKNHTSSISHNHITAIEQDLSGNLWIGTLKGLNRFRESSNDFIRYLDNNGSDSIRGDSISTIYSGDNESLWIGTNGGLNRYIYQDEGFKSFVHIPENAQSLADNRIFSIRQDSNRNIWIGTAKGLNKLDPNSGLFSLYNQDDGLEDNRVAAVMIDETNNLWLAVGSKLNKFDPTKNKFTSIDSPCGANQGAYYQSDDGQLFFGKQGYCAFYPTQIKFTSTPPKIVFSDFKLANKSVEIGNDESKSVLTKAINHTSSITLNYNQNILSFEFAAIDFFSPRDNLYQYRLEGFNQDWIETGSDNRRATYTNLRDGRYIFKVKASNNKNIWTDKAREIELIILPPPWRTWWAYFIYIFIIILVIGIFVRHQLNKVNFERNLNRKLETKVRLRTKELEEKNDELNEAMLALEELSLTDQLTGLHNRHFVNKFIEQEISNLKRDYFNLDNKQRPVVGFIMIDADHFKSVNDNYGHDAGDRILTSLAEILKNTCRSKDWVIRWGGEEFLVISKCSNRKALENLSERIRSNIEQHQFIIDKNTTLTKTCSMGISGYPFNFNQVDAISWQQTLNIADHALYITKTNGRNGWVSLFNKKIDFSITSYELILEELSNMIQSNQIGFKTSLNKDKIDF